MIGTEKNLPALTLWQGDCLKWMKEIPDQGVDMILCDLPYGMTECEWDKRIDLDALWQEYKRVMKEHTAVVLFSAQPFTTDLINSNRKMFRYDIVWQKNRTTGFLNANRMPLRIHENILVFYRHLPVYRPQKALGKPYKGESQNNSSLYGKCSRATTINQGDRYPKSVISFDTSNLERGYHPTVKPVSLLEYLIRTYTNEGETVLDNCMGSGSTGVACIRTRRKFVGIELDPNYFQTAQQRIQNAQSMQKGGTQSERNG